MSACPSAWAGSRFGLFARSLIVACPHLQISAMRDWLTPYFRRSTMSSCQSMSPNLSGFRHRVNRFSDNGADYRAPMRETARTEFGTRLRDARKRAGLTQADLAKRAGMPLSTLAESETKGQGSTYTPQLAAACGVSPEWLATGEGPMQAKWTWPFVLLTPDQLRSLSAEHLATVEKVALGLLGVTKVPPSSDAPQATTVPSSQRQSLRFELEPRRKKDSGHSDSAKANPRKSSGG